MKASEFIGLLFLARDYAHGAHLSAKGNGSFAKHMALGAFYEGIIGLADGFAEAYQGRHGLIGAIPLQSGSKTTDPVEFLQSQLDEIEKKRYLICKKEDSPLQNLIDGIIELYLTTIYKLKFLG
jgi:hypothetical protein